MAGPDCETCVRYVDLTAEADKLDGMTWERGYKTLHSAIISARLAVLDGAPRCEVWVAKGIYRIYGSIESVTPEEVTVRMESRVDLYGGFAGGETQRKQRDFEENETVLDGRDATHENAVLHVVSGASDSVLDGFSITGGDAGFSKLSSCSDVASSCPDQLEQQGGGLFNLFADMTVRNCTFFNNRAACTGGGVYNKRSDARYENCRFVENQSCREAGGMIIRDASVVELERSSFSGNESKTGGGLYVHSSDVVVNNGLFYENTASGTGGAASATYSAYLRFEHCTFAKNIGFFGRTVYSGQRDDFVGTGLTFVNSILWNDDGKEPTSNGELLLVGVGQLLSDCIIRGGASGAHILSEDPDFVASHNADFHLKATSPGIDAAGMTTLEVDFEGTHRGDALSIENTGVCPPCADIGAFEYVSE